MREELSGNFLELSLAMLREPLAFHIDLINVLLKVCNFMIIGTKRIWPKFDLDMIMYVIGSYSRVSTE